MRDENLNRLKFIIEQCRPPWLPSEVGTVADPTSDWLDLVIFWTVITAGLAGQFQWPETSDQKPGTSDQ